MSQLNAYYEKYSPNNTLEYIVKAIEEKGVDWKSVILSAHQLTLQEAKSKPLHYQGRNWWATTFNGNIIGLMIDTYRDLMKTDTEGRVFMELASDIRVYFKKMDEQFKVNHVKTNHVKNLWSQMIFSDETKIHTLFVGYILVDEDYTQLKGVYAAYPSSFYKKKVDWKIDLSSYVKEHRFTIEETETEDLLISSKNQNKKENIA